LNRCSVQKVNLEIDSGMILFCLREKMILVKGQAGILTAAAVLFSKAINFCAISHLARTFPAQRTEVLTDLN
jgi:hypothetical protein